MTDPARHDDSGPALSPVNRISPQTLRDLLTTDQEIALIDVREEGAFSTGHLFHACCVPASRFELLMRARLPRRTVTIVLTAGSTDDDHLVQATARVLQAAGYTVVSMLAGGTRAWQEAGFEIYTGVNVPSKAFGEFVEHWYQTPRLPAAEVQAMQARGDKLVILDSRPFDEFRRMSIPGGVDCPGAELVYRVHDQVADEDTVIIVNCAGRTRSIIGAQSLINAGLRNPIYALKDGTMGWKLAGLELAHGETRMAPAPGPTALARAQACAQAVASRHGVESIDAQALARWLQDDSRTTLILDVRTAQEFAAGHWPGAQHAPGGQLVQATDEFVAVRQARLVLADSADGVRATMTAHWLRQLGWSQVRVLTEPPAQWATGQGAESSLQALGINGLREAQGIPVTSLAQRLPLPANAALLDFAVSRDYRGRGHLPGACWALRARLPECIAMLPGVDEWILTADDERLAHLAAASLSAPRPHDAIRVLEGGTPAWIKAGLALETQTERLLTAIDDIWSKPYDRGDPTAAMQDYLTWEVGLVEQVERDDLVRFERTG